MDAAPLPLPGKGVLGWLGRQVGYLARAVKADVGQTTVYRQERIEEHEHPGDPNLTLRRTTIDQAIAKHPKSLKRDAKKG